MSDILDKLHNDHINFIRLLSFLENQLSLLLQCKDSNLESIIDAIKYMKEYPDYIHHPLENIVFKYYLEHYGNSHTKIKELLREHDFMPVLTDRLLTMLQNAIMANPQSRDELCRNLEKYISIQREHMNQEEAYVYPDLKTNLNKNDWKKIVTELTHIDDPLFGAKVEKSYQGLFYQIVS